MKKTPNIIIAVIVAAGLVGGGIYLGTKKSNNSKSVSPSQTAVSTKKGQPDLSTVLANLQKQFPTIQQTYIYTEQKDPNHQLGKTGYYVAGAEFYDTRTNSPPTEDVFGNDAGGAIEVYGNTSDAAKRVQYLTSFQNQNNPLLDPGAFKQVGKIVVRVSSTYTKSQQDEVINYLSSQLQ